MLNWRRPVLTAGLRVARPAVHRELAVLRRVEFDRAALGGLHEERLVSLLRHAWATTDYYREVLGDTGVVRDGAVDLARFRNVPFLTKDVIRDHFDRLTSRALPGGRRVRTNNTSGSTGQPSRFLQDSHYWDVNIATKTFHFGWFGKRLGDRELKIWGSEHDLLKGREGLVPRAEAWLYNRRAEQCFVLPDERVREIVRTVDAYRPASIWAYRDGIDVVAQHVNRHGLRVHRPKAVFVGNGTVYPHVVESVGRAFGGAPVVNLYGSREAGDVACQCPELGGLHLSTNAHKVEVVGPDGRPAAAGEEGELAITSLHNRAMPFVRYRIGDRARALPGSCPCGRAFPLIGAVSGRVIERLVNARGDSVDPLFLIHTMAMMCDLGLVRRFQVVQEAPDRLTFNIVLVDGAGRGAVEARLPGVARDVRVVMGQGCRVDHRFVGDIPLTASGKHPYVVRRESVRGPAEPAAVAA